MTGDDASSNVVVRVVHKASDAFERHSRCKIFDTYEQFSSGYALLLLRSLCLCLRALRRRIFCFCRLLRGFLVRLPSRLLGRQSTLQLLDELPQI